MLTFTYVFIFCILILSLTTLAFMPSYSFSFSLKSIHFNSISSNMLMHGNSASSDDTEKMELNRQLKEVEQQLKDNLKLLEQLSQEECKLKLLESKSEDQFLALKEIEDKKNKLQDKIINLSKHKLTLL